MRAGRLGLVGRDMSGTARLAGRRLRISPALLAGLIISALAIAALRVDLIRVRYGLADALREEKALLEQRREASARLQALRDPARLAHLAGERELVRPDRIIDLPPTAPAVSAPPETGP